MRVRSLPSRDGASPKLPIVRLAHSGRALLGKVPLRSDRPDRPDWLRMEVLERLHVLEAARVRKGSRVVEVASGPQAITTMPLAYMVGPAGRVIAVERSRWGEFSTLLDEVGLSHRVHALQGDAELLPLRSRAVDLAVCVHGIRSLGTDRNVVRVLREMLRVSPRSSLAESLPSARTRAQRAHLRMYGLRAPSFRLAWGRIDDRPYRPLHRLVSLVKRAGGHVEEVRTIDMRLPHTLAAFPRSILESAPPGSPRARLLHRWDEANLELEQFGEEHPPAGTISATSR